MGRRGPAPLPTADKVRRGTQKACRLNPDEPQYDGPADHAPPATLTGRGRVEWIARIGDSVRLGVVQAPDLPTLEHYCRILTDLEWLSERVAKSSGSRRVTLLSAKNKLLVQFKALARELGYTPSARAGVKAEPKKEESKLAGFVRTPLTAVK